MDRPYEFHSWHFAFGVRPVIRKLRMLCLIGDTERLEELAKNSMSPRLKRMAQWALDTNDRFIDYENYKTNRDRSW